MGVRGCCIDRGGCSPSRPQQFTKCVFSIPREAARLFVLDTHAKHIEVVEKNIFSDWNRQPEDILENIPPELDTVQEK